MVATDRVLMGPGPCNPYPEATAGLGRPLLGHLDPEFLAILDEQPLDPAAVLQAHPSPKVIAVVHAETSTGVRNDVAAIAAGKGDALLLADCVTSLGGIPVAVDAWGLDVAYSGTQKCLGVAPGLAPFTLNPRAWERRIVTPRSWYFDLGLIGDYTAGPARKYHHTAPVAMITSLHAALAALLEEGLQAAWERHAECGAALQTGLEKMGLELWAPEGHRLPQLTTVFVPDGVDDAGVRRTLLARYGIEIGGGAGPWAGQIWRIGCMGHTARSRNVTLLLAALAETLGR